MESSKVPAIPSVSGYSPADHYNNEMADHMVVKCVVVGDTAVGKSHLVCARAQGTKYTLQDLVLQTHISTIWAVDLYRDNAEVRRRSRCEIDGVNCTLRLWDTFGNHDKNRQFSYSNADVAIICFSAVNRRSLQNVETFWIPEVRRNCGMVPIIICCCQIDYRYLLSEPSYVKLEKGPFKKKLNEADVLMPEDGRAIARKYGASYYETSVLAQYGIDDLFNNAIRACLFQKRRSQIFSKLGYLKHVTKPHLQVPHLPPKPTAPEFQQLATVGGLKSSRSRRDLQSYCDVTFVVGAGARLYAHWVYLIAASPVFSRLYQRRTDQMINLSRSDFISMSYSTDTDGSRDGARSNSGRASWKSETNLASALSCSMWIGDPPDHSIYRSQQLLAAVGELDISITNDVIGNAGDDDDDRDENAGSRLLDTDELSMDATSTSQGHFRHHGRALDQQSSLASSVVTLKAGRGAGGGDNEDQLTIFSDVDSGYNAQTTSMSTSVNSIPSTAFVSVEVRRRENKMNGPEWMPEEETVIVVHDSIEASTFEDVLHYVYTGQLPADDRDHFRYKLLRRAAQKIGMTDLETALANVLNKEEYLNVELEQKFQTDRIRRIEELFLKQDFLADVVFQLDNGTVPAHRAFLMSRSDMMLSMFNLDFSEKSTNQVPFGGASVGGFRGLMTYLYTGKCPRECDDWASLIELADRLCLTGLLNDIQLPCVEHLHQLASFNGSVDASELTDIVLGVVEAAKLHKTEQVERWCHWYLQANFNEVVENHLNTFEGLPAETQKLVIRNRWPPRWYLLEVDAYERALMLMTKQRPEASWLKRPNGEVVDPTHCFGFLRRRKQP